jgi:D-serine deaminase-like pyridoxal phosphate-dependent protein
VTAPRTLADIPTPALLIDVPAMERNIARMSQFFAERSCHLRPHFKAHKTPEIARRQLAAGSCVGLTCATVSEAEIAAALSRDILIANEVIGRDKCARVAALAQRIDITMAVDSQTGLEQISQAVREAKTPHGETRVGVLIDINVGMTRCGVMPGEAALALARVAAEAPGVRLRGVMGYEGHAVGVADRGERRERAGAAMDALLSTAALIRQAGLTCEIVSAGGTGTYDISGAMDGITEIQAGSYVLMDAAYAQLDIPFERALSLLGTVISRPARGLCVADCGHKSCTHDHGPPAVKGIPGATVRVLNDEHATIVLPSDAAVAVGSRIQLWPSHIDPTINLHDVLYALDGDRVIGVWPIAARGYAEQRHAAGDS